MLTHTVSTHHWQLLVCPYPADMACIDKVMHTPHHGIHGTYCQGHAHPTPRHTQPASSRSCTPHKPLAETARIVKVVHIPGKGPNEEPVLLEPAAPPARPGPSNGGGTAPSSRCVPHTIPTHCNHAKQAAATAARIVRQRGGRCTAAAA